METCKMQPLKKSICPARRVLNLLKGKFTLEILSEIIDGNIHYGSLLRSVEGINPRILGNGYMISSKKVFYQEKFYRHRLHRLNIK